MGTKVRSQDHPLRMPDEIALKYKIISWLVAVKLWPEVMSVPQYLQWVERTYWPEKILQTKKCSMII